MKVQRYEIYFANLNPTADNEVYRVRPVVVISQDTMNRYLETIVVCPLTSSLHRAWRSRLQITCAGRPAEIAVDQIRTICKNRLRQRIDSLSKADTFQLRKLISEMYGEAS